MVRRGSVTVTHTDDNDYSRSIYTICSEEQTLQSGMMLNHCILYREISFKTFHLKAFGFTKDLENKTAYIALSYTSTGTLTESIITFSQATNHINTIISNINPNPNSSSNSHSNFVWIHLVDKQCLSLLAKKFTMPPIAINAFMDVIPRTTFNVFTDQSILLTVTSFCRHDDGIICSVKVCCYIKKNIIIIQERRTHASVQEITNAMSQHPSSPSVITPSGGNSVSRNFDHLTSPQHGNANPTPSHRSSPTPTATSPATVGTGGGGGGGGGTPAGSAVGLGSSSPTQTHNNNNGNTTPAQRHRLSEAQSSLGVSLRSVLHSIRASHVTEAETKEQDDTGNLFGPYSGRVYNDLKQKLSSMSSWNQLIDRGIPYILYELIYTMLEMTTPVISFYSQRQLALHDSVYVREEPPTHTEGNAILDRVDFIKAGFQLMENLTERSTLCLVGHREKLTNVMPEEYVSDIISSYEHALDVITDMHEELSRITDNINGIITRRNEQISIVLSLVATVFLPLTFIAGVFGMNFSNGGVLVYMLDTSHGENYFWGSCAFCVLLCFYIFISKGWMDMLGKVRRGGQSNVIAVDGTDFVTFVGIQWNNFFRKETRIATED